MILTGNEDMYTKYTIDYANMSIRYGDMKKDLGAAVAGFVAPIRDRVEELMENPDYIRKVLKTGGTQARESAVATIREARKLMGINYY